MSGTKEDKLKRHEAFWKGEGPSLLLIPPGEQELYDLADYPRRYYDPRAMWESEIRRASPVIEWPTDGISTVRPNLGVTFVPSMAGQDFTLPENAMPWPGKAMSREAIRKVRGLDITASESMRLAAEFYEIHADSGQDEIAAYHADTQGVFDIAHLLNGDNTFYEVVEPPEAEGMDELLEICHELYVRATDCLKSMLSEPAGSMIHGHGTSQGAYFPNAGTRMAEDTAILLSPGTIDRFILPTIQKAAAPFGGAFVHFCGKHPPLLERLCEMGDVRAIDLGNPEMYDTRWVLKKCAESGTVLYSRLAAEPDEHWEAYVRRIGKLVSETRARVILRPLATPSDRSSCQAMLDIWHELTE